MKASRRPPLSSTYQLVSSVDMALPLAVSCVLAGACVGVLGGIACLGELVAAGGVLVGVVGVGAGVLVGVVRAGAGAGDLFGLAGVGADDSDGVDGFGGAAGLKENVGVGVVDFRIGAGVFVACTSAVAAGFSTL